MNFQEKARALEGLSEGFRDATESLDQIFKDLEIIPHSVPEDAIATAKYAASAAIIEDADVVEHFDDPNDIGVAVQLGKIGSKIRVALPGGAVRSQQEREWIAQNPDENAPGHLFYQLAQEQLLAHGDLNFTYDMDAEADGFLKSLRGNLARQLSEEMGEGAASYVEFGSFLSGSYVTPLPSIGVPNEEARDKIALSLAERGVTIDSDNGKLKGIFTNVTEKIAVAFGPLDEIERLATDNEEAHGMRVKSLGELLEMSCQTADSVEGYRNFKEHYSDCHDTDGIRNPSTTLGLQLLSNWLKDRAIEADPYVEGPRPDSGFGS